MQTINKLLLAAIFGCISLFAQAQKLQIQVIDENKEPLAGAAIYARILGVYQRSVTNLDGKCDIAATDSVIVAFGGYKTRQIVVDLLKKKPIVELELSQKNLSIKQMVYNKPIVIAQKKDSIDLKSGAYSVTYFDEVGKEESEKIIEKRDATKTSEHTGGKKIETLSIKEVPVKNPETIVDRTMGVSADDEAVPPPPPVVISEPSREGEEKMVIVTTSDAHKSDEGKPITIRGSRSSADMVRNRGVATESVKISSAPSPKIAMSSPAAAGPSMAPTKATKGKKAAPSTAPKGGSYSWDLDTKKADKDKAESHIKDKAAEKTVEKSLDIEREAQAPKKVAAHQLTAGEVNDFNKWTLWKDIALTQLEEHRKEWQVMPMQRYMVQLQTENGLPIIDATVELMENEKAVWAAKTDNTGKAEMWLDAFERNLTERSDLSLKVTYKSKSYNFSTVKRFQKGINIFKLPVKCDMPTKIDVAFIVDATGSMGDEIDYLKAELADIASRVKDSLRANNGQISELRVGSVFYKDRGDDYLTIFSDFDKDIKKADNFVEKQSAGGGGDTPEAVEDALEAANRDLKWSENAAARIAFLIMDAPPHNTPEIKAKLEANIRKFAERGVRLIPVACSGTDKSTEYLMRSFALLTNGTYLSLTDDSGIGGSHIKPTTDKMAVEFLNDAMVRLIMQFGKTPSCNEQLPTNLAQRDTVKAVLPDTSAVKDPKKQPYAIPVYKIYPNPTAGMVYLDTDGSVGNIYLCDLNGKILSQIAINNRARMQFDLTDYPAGTYLLRYEYAPDKWLTSKIIRVR